jgi:hypothetical protein
LRQGSWRRVRIFSTEKKKRVSGIEIRYATIGAVLMNKRVAEGIRDGSNFWHHGHTYQVTRNERDMNLF